MVVFCTLTQDLAQNCLDRLRMVRRKLRTLQNVDIGVEPLKWGNAQNRGRVVDMAIPLGLTIDLPKMRVAASILPLISAITRLLCTYNRLTIQSGAHRTGLA